MGTGGLEKELYDVDAGLPAGPVTFSVSEPATQPSPSSGIGSDADAAQKYVVVLGRLSRLLAERLGMHVSLTPENYGEILTDDVRKKVAGGLKNMGYKRYYVKVGLEGLPVLYDSRSVHEISELLQVPVNTIRQARSTLIRLGVIDSRSSKQPRKAWDSDITSYESADAAVGRLSTLLQSVGIDGELSLQTYDGDLEKLGGARALAGMIREVYELSPVETWNLPTALRRLRTLARNDIQMNEKAEIEGLSRGTVLNLRSILIKIGVLDAIPPKMRRQHHRPQTYPLIAKLKGICRLADEAGLDAEFVRPPYDSFFTARAVKKGLLESHDGVKKQSTEERMLKLAGVFAGHPRIDSEYFCRLGELIGWFEVYESSGRKPPSEPYDVVAESLKAAALKTLYDELKRYTSSEKVRSRHYADRPPEEIRSELYGLLRS